MEPVVEDRSEDSGKDAFVMEDWPFYWLARFSGRYNQQMEKSLKAIGLDIPQWRVLMALRDSDSLGVGEIADHAIIKLPTMTKIVKRMEAEGLIACTQRESDHRVTDVSLTPHGMEASEKAWDIAHRIYARAFEDVSEKDIARLNKLLRVVTRDIVE